MKKFSTIIFLTESFFCKKDYPRWGIECLQKNGLIAEVWQITDILYPAINKAILSDNEFEKRNLINFSSKSELVKKLSTITSETLLIMMVGYQLSTYWLYRQISKRKISYAHFELDYHPIGNKKLNKKNLSFSQKIKQIPWRRGGQFFFRRIPYQFLGIKEANYVLAGGRESCGYARPQGRNTEIIWLHSPDYDKYLETKDFFSTEITINKKKKLAVFLDEGGPYHPDFEYTHVQPPMIAENYYSALRRFFNYLENEFNYKVIIACHPRFAVEKYPAIYAGYEVIQGKTAELVKEASLVIAHMSTAINYAVLYKKPVVLTTTNEINNSHLIAGVNNMSFYLGINPINLDKPNNLTEDFLTRINVEKYEEYKKDYIKNDTNQQEDKMLWELFVDKINEL